MQHKYHATRCEVDGIKFVSKREGNRYLELKTLERAGHIAELRLQVPFELVEPYEYKGKKIRGVKYLADFVYIREGRTVVEDVKGFKTPVYELKKKLLLRVLSWLDYDFIET